MSDYCKYEKVFIDLFDGDLNITSAKTVMDSYLINQGKIVHIHAYYLLELSFLEDKITAYNLAEICLGIKFIMTNYSESLKKK